MARSLTTPVTEETINKQVITKINVDLAYNPATGAVDLSNSQMSYRVINLPSQEEAGYNVRPGNEIPQVMKDAVRTVLNLCYTDADNQGYLEAGTDSDDL